MEGCFVSIDSIRFSFGSYCLPRGFCGIVTDMPISKKRGHETGIIAAGLPAETPYDEKPLGRALTQLLLPRQLPCDGTADQFPCHLFADLTRFLRIVREELTEADAHLIRCLLAARDALRWVAGVVGVVIRVVVAGVQGERCSLCERHGFGELILT